MMKMNVQSATLLALCFALLTLAATPVTYCQDKGQLYVTYMDGAPENVAVGDKVTIFFNVIYYVGTLYCGNISQPVIGLKTASFQLSSATQTITLSDVAIEPTEKPGQYTVTLEIKPDYPTGKATIYVDENSLSIVIEKVHYSGPPSLVSSVETEDQSDYSIVQVSAPTPSPTPIFGSSAWVFPLIAIIAVIGAILVYLGFKVSRKRE